MWVEMHIKREGKLEENSLASTRWNNQTLEPSQIVFSPTTSMTNRRKGQEVKGFKRPNLKFDYFSL